MKRLVFVFVWLLTMGLEAEACRGRRGIRNKGCQANVVRESVPPPAVVPTPEQLPKPMCGSSGDCR